MRGPDADHAGRQWRDEHRGWDNNGIWRRKPNWWRRDRGFRLFIGPRIGFLFIPEMGYVSVPPEYQHGYWAPGGFLPSWFWRYVVRDYWRYGLPAPPPGCIWVWVDDDIALIDADTGYIVDMVRNVW
ncbi:RcnB family protein [Phenylobacterium montanum]|nr:RcnB family protein [Caulobacter sp. S6]